MIQPLDRPFVTALVLRQLDGAEFATSARLRFLSAEAPTNVIGDLVVQMKPKLRIHSLFPTATLEPRIPHHCRFLTPRRFREPTRSPRTGASSPPSRLPVAVAQPW